MRIFSVFTAMADGATVVCRAIAGKVAVALGTATLTAVESWPFAGFT